MTSTSYPITLSYSLRFTFSSPSSLIAHLPQATLTIASIPQLTQLLVDEIGSCLLNRICELGSTLCEPVHGTWFVDLLTGRSVGRWEGHVLWVSLFFSSSSVSYKSCMAETSRCLLRRMN